MQVTNLINATWRNLLKQFRGSMFFYFFQFSSMHDSWNDCFGWFFSTLPLANRPRADKIQLRLRQIPFAGNTSRMLQSYVIRVSYTLPVVLSCFAASEPVNACCWMILQVFWLSIGRTAIKVRICFMPDVGNCCRNMLGIWVTMFHFVEFLRPGVVGFPFCFVPQSVTVCCIRSGLTFWQIVTRQRCFLFLLLPFHMPMFFCVRCHFQNSVWPLCICRFNLKTAFTFLCKSCRNLQLCEREAFVYPYPRNPWYQIAVLLTLLLDGLYTLQPLSNTFHTACHLRIQVFFFKILLLVLPLA